MEKEPEKPKKPKFQAPTGMHDILFKDQRYFQKIYNVCEDIASFYGFKKIDTPILEDTNLFLKGIGLSTDIVQKQMYSFRTKGGDSLSLRPEGTASIVRAFLQNGMFNLPQPVKLWYFGPFFRYEHPQAGRYRQFHQFGFEVLGEVSPVVDVQIIQIFSQILKSLKFKKLDIELNSIGDSKCRPYYKKLLASYLKSREASLCINCRRRVRENPLRVLDCKEEKCQPIIAQAPQLIDHLCKKCHGHFKEVLEFLDELELSYQLNPYLVRGLDYYTRTVFEISEDTEAGREQGALVGGGRYGNLVKLLGRRDVPASGGAAGIERMVILMKEKKMRLPLARKSKIFLAQVGNLAKKKSLKLFEEFRKAKIGVTESFSRDSLKTQLARADRAGVKYTLILGQKEALEGTIIIRDMETGAQKIVKLAKIVEEMKKRLKE